MGARAHSAFEASCFGILFWLVAHCAAGAEAKAEVSGLIEAGASQSHFYIEPSYDGTTIVLFGSVDRERLKGQAFDIAVTLRGPIKPVTIWKKDRRAGLWVNSQSLTFEGVPNFYAVLSTRPADQIAPLEERKAYEIGLDALTLPLKPGDNVPAEATAPLEFQSALIRLKKAGRLFVEDSQSTIEFFGDRLFRSRVFLPASAGQGVYRANFYVLRSGKVVGAASANIYLKKIGIEARLSSAATQHPWLYGVVAVLLAAAVGSGASLIFRRA
jgi:uncharacterized protein (TIGR02186 family)